MMKTRIVYGFLLVIAVVCGLSTREGFAFIPSFIETYGGDTLWAMALYFLLRLIAPRVKPYSALLICIGLSFTVEFSQLYHAPWIDEIRSWKIGGLILGFGFKWTDLICYTTGSVLGWIIEHILVSRTGSS